MSSNPIVVLGCGLVGSAIVKDLALMEERHVVAVDISRDNLDALPDHERIQTRVENVSEPGKVAELVAGEQRVLCGSRNAGEQRYERRARERDSKITYLHRVSS